MQSKIDEEVISSNSQREQSSKSFFEEIISNFPSIKKGFNSNEDKAFFIRFSELFQTNTSSLQSQTSNTLEIITNIIIKKTEKYDESQEIITDIFIYFLMKIAVSESNNIYIQNLDHIVKMNKLEERIQGKLKKDDIYSFFDSNEMKFIHILKKSSWIWIYHLNIKLKKTLFNIIFSYFHDDLFYDKLNILKTISKIIAFIYTYPNIYSYNDDNNNSESSIDNIDHGHHHTFVLTILKLSNRYGMLLLNVPWIVDYLTILKHDQTIMKSDFIKNILYEFKIIHKTLKESLNKSLMNEQSIINYLFLSSTIEPIFKLYNYDIQHDMPQLSMNYDEDNDIIEGFKSCVSSHNIDTSLKLKFKDDMNFFKDLKSKIESLPLSSNKEEVSIKNNKPKKIKPIIINTEVNDRNLNPNIQYFVTSVLSTGLDHTQRIIKKELISLMYKHIKNGIDDSNELIKRIHNDIVEKSMAYCEEKLKRLFKVMMPNISDETLSSYMNEAKWKLKDRISDIIMKSLSNENIIMKEQKKINDLSVILMNGDCFDDIQIESLFNLSLFTNKSVSFDDYMVSLHFIISYAPYKINEDEIRNLVSSKTEDEDDYTNDELLPKDEKNRKRLIKYCNRLYRYMKSNKLRCNRMIDILFQRYEPFEDSFFAKMLTSKYGYGKYNYNCYFILLLEDNIISWHHFEHLTNRIFEKINQFNESLIHNVILWIVDLIERYHNNEKIKSQSNYSNLSFSFTLPYILSYSNDQDIKNRIINIFKPVIDSEDMFIDEL